jgi:hypothetical protein
MVCRSSHAAAEKRSGEKERMLNRILGALNQGAGVELLALALALTSVVWNLDPLSSSNRILSPSVPLLANFKM